MKMRLSEGQKDKVCWGGGLPLFCGGGLLLPGLGSGVTFSLNSIMKLIEKLFSNFISHF